MKKPTIGITLDYAESGEYSSYPYYLLRHNYASAIEKFGGIPIFLHYSNDLIDSYSKVLNGLLVTGGNFDVSPELYGQQVSSSTVKLNSIRTDFEFRMVKAAMKKKMPIFGICGGEQLLNVICSGNLVQDIPSQIQTQINHEQRTPKHLNSHRVKVVKESKLFEIIGQEDIEVNSTHHQAVKDPGTDIKISAYAPDNVVEAIELTNYPFGIGVQWHPEYLTNEHDEKLFKSFIEASKTHGKDSNNALGLYLLLSLMMDY